MNFCAYVHSAQCTHCAVAVAVAVACYYCHFDAIKIERTTKIHVIGMEKWVERRGGKGQTDCEIVSGKLACEPNTGSLKGVAYCWLFMGQTALMAIRCTGTNVCGTHTISLFRHTGFLSHQHTFDRHFVQQYH